MKKQKLNRSSGHTTVKRRSATANAFAKSLPSRSRPLHAHIALHPMSILVLLCMGMLLVSFTLNAVADSYLVTAIVPAPPLTQPATISSPADGLITGTQAIVVRGTCPANSYVDLYDDNNFVGEAICGSGSFRIGITLVEGANRLQAQDYNITNAPGPTSSPVTVTYVPGAPQTPADTGGNAGAVVVGQLVVTQVDVNVPYQQSTKLVVSSQPTFAGVAPPLAQVSVTVQSRPTCTTTANLLGYWSCTVSGVSPGTHAVDVAADAPGGAHLTFPTFDVTVPNPPVPLVVTQTSPIPPLTVSSSYGYSVHNVGQPVPYSISISGGRSPYAVMVSWGDGASEMTVQMSSGTFNVSHIYGWINAEKSTKTVRIEVIDTSGQSATLQFDSIIRNPAFHSAIANITKSSGLWGLFEKLRPWLWLLWPGYIIIVLLVFSFWLGEHQELLLLRERRRLAAIKGKRRHAHAHH